jgi:SPP1 gp7 family putative phage head morphogenesis protein
VLSAASEAIDAVAAHITEHLPPLLVQVIHAAGTASAKRLVKALRTASLRTAKDDVGFKFDETNPKATEWASQNAADLVGGITESARDEIKDLVEHAFEEQVSVDDLAKQIEEVIGDANRAELIARTETMRASNEGQLEAWEQATEDGLLAGNEQKEWIVTPDDKLCPVCEQMDGVIIPLDEDFDVDGDMIEGPPAHPNCRCTLGLSLSS